MRSPSLRTEQANFWHSALQLVVKLQRRSADASRLVSGSSNGWLLLPGRPTDAEHQWKVCILALRFTDLSPEDICGACFLLSFARCLHLPAFLCSTGITPFLRYYEGSVPFGYGSSDPLPVMNAVPFPNSDP